MTVPPEQNPLAAGEQSIALRMAAARAAAGEGLRAGRDGVELARTLTADVEAIVVQLAASRFADAALGVSSGVALLATGGFGRREFAPHSDLDLVLLCAESPGPRVVAFAQTILYPLWDAKIDAGHAVRSVQEALELPASDLTAATALLDARFLVGDRGLADHFLAMFAAKVAGSSPGSFVARLQAEQKTRHSRFGDTIFLLEPDLKNGPGGVRDLCAGRWAALARFGTGNPRVLHSLGEMSARQAAAFEAAREWQLRVRCALHLVAGRRQDQLRFDFQEKLAPLLYGDALLYDDASLPAGDIRPAVAPAVEALMHAFQLHAKTIRRETQRLLLRAAANPAHKPRVVPVVIPPASPSGPPAPVSGAARQLNEHLDENFVLSDGELEFAAANVLEKKPSLAFRLFQVAIVLDVPISLRTADHVAELAAHQGAALRADAESARRFLDVLTSTADKATPSRLEQMHDLGLLGALMPEWQPVAGRVQHDLYHVYTVDQHSLYAVAMCKALARGEHIDEHPLPTQEMEIVGASVPLYLATLLHDIGKPLGRNHSATGAAVGKTIAVRLGLSEADVARVEFLIRHHLTMGLTSQRRDMDDPGLVERFAAVCGDESALHQLFLVTFCDLVSVGPRNLTSWKYELLRELFRRTLTFMSRGADVLKADRAAMVRRRQRQTAHKLGETGEASPLTALLDSFPERYFMENTVGRIAAHLTLIRERKGAVAMQIRHEPALEQSELVLVSEDVPGFLAKVAGVLFANRIDILEAAIYSRHALVGVGQRKGEAVDIFRIRKAGGGAVTDEARLASIQKNLEEVLTGRTTAEALLAARPVSSSPFGRIKPEVPPTEVKVDNDSSQEFTILDIFTQDRPGVLYTIARVLHESGLDIQWSKVATEADRVADIFYVRDKLAGGKIRDLGRLDELRAALKQALPKSDAR